MKPISRRDFVKGTVAGPFAPGALGPFAMTHAGRGDNDFDIVVAGAGHNSLAAAAYLVTAGYRCLFQESATLEPVLSAINFNSPGFTKPLDHLLAQLHSGLALFDIMGAKGPNVKMTIINDAGRFMMRDQPVEFDADLIDFIDYWDNHPIH